MPTASEWEFTPKQLELKRENHYVWANYLKNWSINNLDVWHTTKKLKIARNSVNMIAKEENLYKTQHISKQNLEVILYLSSQSPVELQKIHRAFLNDFLKIQNLEKLYKSSNKADEKIIAHFEAMKSNTLENMHTSIESDVNQILKELQNQNLKVLDESKNMIKFMNFFGHQIARTVPFRDKVLAAQKNERLHSIFKESWWCISYIFGMNIGADFFKTRKIDKHCLLINDSNEDFITSDHPIINVHSKINETDLIAPSSEEADYFYAISPKLGYMINKSDLFPNGINHVSIDFVKKMNRKLAFYADQYIIGTSETQLKVYKEFVGQRLKVIKERSKSLNKI